MEQRRIIEKNNKNHEGAFADGQVLFSAVEGGERMEDTQIKNYSDLLKKRLMDE